eukprot:scaffold519_cov179-Ochromonas_danica.AAC.2
MENNGNNVPYWRQFYFVLERFALTYWRTPSYLLVRVAMNLIIALIFASAYPNQKYRDSIETSSRATVIFITSLFATLNALNAMVPVSLDARSVFYHEQQSRMYAVSTHWGAQIIMEAILNLSTSVVFVLPFFYIVGYNKPGNEAQKFMWYWFLTIMIQGTLVCMGNMFVALAPDQPTIHILNGMASMIMSMFCGFLITQDSFPTFWLFVYWLNPFHYALEGLIMTQFHKDDTVITTSNGEKVTAEYYITEVQFKDWSYDHVGYDVLALGVATYFGLLYLRHERR